VSFIPVIALLAVLWLCQPRPMPTIEGISNMPWWGAARRCSWRLRGHCRTSVRRQGRGRRARGSHDHRQYPHVARH
jgi:hypothetical protein